MTMLQSQFDDQNVSVGVDRFIGLPLPLIYHIVSFLPVEEMVRTCVLSKGWRNVWSIQRVYKDSVEKEMRFQVFKTNVEYIDTFNKVGDRTYVLSVNGFADQTNEEFIASRNGYKNSPERKSGTAFMYENVTAVPSSMDWRKKGAVTPIKDQGQCGR
ncbi:hypothetical protein IFM89_007971 [Coptis chinensis]|uniref:F-box domain-containing protein n=1 Tax=Coptis chinensis TaxID=261450 RepID=A0A835IKR2_9MAGN|nr:hypothetical protein IFM89_007971 [Coptis chinensis]